MNNSKKVSMLLSADNRFSHQAYKKILSNKSSHDYAESTSVSKTVLEIPHKTPDSLGDSANQFLYHKKTIKKQCTKTHDNSSYPYNFNKVNKTIRSSSQNPNASFYDPTNNVNNVSFGSLNGYERYKNMPFNLKEKRFEWQTSPVRRELINYENSKLGIRVNSENHLITNTTNPNKLPLNKELQHLKCGYKLATKNTSSVVNLKERGIKTYKPKRVDKDNKRLSKNKNFNKTNRNSSVGLGIASLINKTPTVFPILGKRKINSIHEEPVFKPSLKQVPKHSCLNSSLKGAAVVTAENQSPVENGYSKFNNMKNLSSYASHTDNNEFANENKRKKMIRLNSTQNLADNNNLIYKNKTSMEGNSRNARQEEKMSRRLSTSVIDFRYKSNFALV